MCTCLRTCMCVTCRVPCRLQVAKNISYTCMYTRIHVHMSTYMYVCHVSRTLPPARSHEDHLHMHIFMCIRVYVHVFRSCVSECICVYTYAYIGPSSHNHACVKKCVCAWDVYTHTRTSAHDTYSTFGNVCLRYITSSCTCRWWWWWWCNLSLLVARKTAAACALTTFGALHKIVFGAYVYACRYNHM
jgi:hypothetical protein